MSDPAVLLYVVIPIVVIVCLLIARLIAARSHRKQLQQAYADYQLALDALREHPTNTHVRQQALDLGRKYGFLSRLRGGVPVFDETALMHDISAVTADATQEVRESIAVRLTILDELRMKGLISPTEYEQRREAVLEEAP